MTLYDSVYLYLKLSSEALSRGGDKSTITNGAFMYNQAKNYYAETSKCCCSYIPLFTNSLLLIWKSVLLEILGQKASSLG